MRPHADQAQPRPAHLALQRHGALEPFSGAHIAVGGRELARGAKHQAEGGVCHLVVQHIRRVRDHHATRLGRSHVDAVVADTHHRDQLQRRQPRDELPGHLGLAAGGNGADVRRHRGEGRNVAFMQAIVHAVGCLQGRQIQRRQARGGEDINGGQSGLLGSVRLIFQSSYHNILSGHASPPGKPARHEFQAPQEARRAAQPAVVRPPGPRWFCLPQLGQGQGCAARPVRRPAGDRHLQHLQRTHALQQPFPHAG